MSIQDHFTTFTFRNELCNNTASKQHDVLLFIEVQIFFKQTKGFLIFTIIKHDHYHFRKCSHIMLRFYKLETKIYTCTRTFVVTLWWRADVCPLFCIIGSAVSKFYRSTAPGGIHCLTIYEGKEGFNLYRFNCFNNKNNKTMYQRTRWCSQLAWSAQRTLLPRMVDRN